MARRLAPLRRAAAAARFGHQPNRAEKLPTTQDAEWVGHHNEVAAEKGYEGLVLTRH